MRKLFKTGGEASETLLPMPDPSEKRSYSLKKNEKTRSLSPSSFSFNPFNNKELLKNTTNSSSNKLSGVSSEYKKYIEPIIIITKQEKPSLQKIMRKTKSLQLFNSCEKKATSIEPDKIREYVVVKFKNPAKLNMSEFSKITFDIKMTYINREIGKDYKIIIENYDQITHLDFNKINMDGFINLSDESLSSTEKTVFHEMLLTSSMSI